MLTSENIDMLVKFEQEARISEPDIFVEDFNAEEFKEEIDKFKNSKAKKECSRTNTKAVIYPKSPYGENDFEVKAELDCGFEDKK